MAGSSRRVRIVRSVSSSALHSTASAPCPGAGSIWPGSRISEAASRRPSRARPAAATTTASSSPSLTLRNRVSTLPRMASTSKPRPRARSCAVRRGEPVPTRDPLGSSASVTPSRLTRASRGSSRCGNAMTTRPSAGCVGRSLSECTAKSMLPARSWRRSSVTKTPVPPNVASASLDRSPSVTTSTSSTSRPCLLTASATVVDCVSASVDRRVPRRSVDVAVVT